MSTPLSNDDRQQKIVDLVTRLAASEEGAGWLRAGLDAAGLKSLKVVEKMTFKEVEDPVRQANAREAVVLDTETTGLEPKTDKVIQLSMLKIRYDDQGILGFGEIFDKFNDPGFPIPEEVSLLTGITDAQVAGHRIEPSEVRGFLAGVDRVICHNASFDRKMVEANFPDVGFDELVFDCSIEQVDWLKRGASGRSLEVIALKFGMIYGSHNATNDIRATAFVLAEEHPELGSAFCEMLAKGNTPQLLLVAQSSPFHTKDDLKARGYRWSAEGEETGGYKAWWRMISEDPETLAEEAEALKELYNRDVSLPAFRVSGKERYSARRPEEKVDFRSASILSFADALAQTGHRLEAPQGAC